VSGVAVGGSLEDASCVVALEMASPGDFKFFHSELHFEPGQLEMLFMEGNCLYFVMLLEILVFTVIFFTKILWGEVFFFLESE
jgi:hypothetical protein